MKNSWILTATLGAALAVAAPVELAAQGNSQRARQEQQRVRQEQQRVDVREQARRDAERERLREREAQARRAESAREQARRDAERDRMRDQQRGGGIWGDWDYDDGRRKKNKANAPAFCRSGQGHPVHGRQWCRDKGYALGNERWERARWEDIVLRDRNRRTDQRLGRSTLGDILGSVVLGRFDTIGRGYGGGALSGQWLPESNGTVLQLMVGGVPFAHLVDTNRDGRVDNLLLRR